MKIPAINGFMPMSYQKDNQRVSPNFMGKLTPQQIKKFSLEKKLPYMFENCLNGDIIAVGKNIEEVQKGLLNVVENFKDVVKRVLFIKHGGLSVPLAFSKMSTKVWSCINIGEKPVLIAMEDKVEDIPSRKSSEIYSGDVIVNNKLNIPICLTGKYPKDEKGCYNIDTVDDVLLLSEPENFATESFILDQVQDPKVINVNTEAFELLTNKNVINIEQLEKSEQKEKPINSNRISFKDVGGLDHVIEKLEDAILFPIRFSYAYKEDGVDVNKGVLLHGKPGTGKTLLAEALAGESDAQFIKICGTDFEAKYYGETEKAWRNLFLKARANQPSIIFIDEFDAVVKERGNGDNNQHNDKVVSQILTLMSDLEKSDDKVFVIATTNKPDTMDSAILRSGRFGEIIEVTEPDRNGKKAIFDIHTRKKRIDSSLDIEKLLDEFDKRKFTGADIKHITNKAHTISWERQGIRKKMKDGTLTKQDMVGTCINADDFNKAIEEWDTTQLSRNKRKPIGFNKKN